VTAAGVPIREIIPVGMNKPTCAAKRLTAETDEVSTLDRESEERSFEVEELSDGT
jgi:hypothetical protein